MEEEFQLKTISDQTTSGCIIKEYCVPNVVKYKDILPHIDFTENIKWSFETLFELKVTCRDIENSQIPYSFLFSILRKIYNLYEQEDIFSSFRAKSNKMYNEISFFLDNIRHYDKIKETVDELNRQEKMVIIKDKLRE
jgi:hypothetical protein